MSNAEDYVDSTANQNRKQQVIFDDLNAGYTQLDTKESAEV